MQCAGQIDRAMMDLANMRQNGVHSLAIRCGALGCNHEAVLEVSALAYHVTSPSSGPLYHSKWTFGSIRCRLALFVASALIDLVRLD